jgi:DNA-binding FrmR family transcriptional regulator
MALEIVRLVVRFGGHVNSPLASCAEYTLAGYQLIDIYTPIRYLSNMQTDTKSACAKRLSRIEGQVRGIARMVEDDRYCIDIVTQISAARAALRRVEEEILRDHVAHCVEHAIASGDAEEQRRKVAELMQVFARTER